MLIQSIFLPCTLGIGDTEHECDTEIESGNRAAAVAKEGESDADDR